MIRSVTWCGNRDYVRTFARAAASRSRRGRGARQASCGANDAVRRRSCAL